MPMDKWDACAFPVSEDDLEGRVCYGGLDLSSTTDITVFVLVFPPLDEEDKYCILPYFWVPEEMLELRVRRDHVPYDVWERQGKLMTAERLHTASKSGILYSERMWFKWQGHQMYSRVWSLRSKSRRNGCLTSLGYRCQMQSVCF